MTSQDEFPSTALTKEEWEKMPRTVCTIRLSFLEEDWLQTRKENYQVRGWPSIGYCNPEKSHVIFKIPDERIPLKIPGDLHVVVRLEFAFWEGIYQIARFVVHKTDLMDAFRSNSKDEKCTIHLEHTTDIPTITESDHVISKNQLMLRIKTKDMILDGVHIAIPIEFFRKVARAAEFACQRPNECGKMGPLFLE